MSCYHPFLGRPDYRDGVNPEGKFKYKISGYYDTSVAEPNDIPIPCGKCIGCRLDYSREWADRMALELEHHNGHALFATLTYRNMDIPVAEYSEVKLSDDVYLPLGVGERWIDKDLYIPKTYTLDKKDLSDFMKRLRSRAKFEDREIRFYGCGEYGEHTRRPHMHVIIFGVSLSDFIDLVPHGFNELKQQYFYSKEFERIWKKGFTLITDVSWNTFAYVSRYVMKKAFADDLSYEQLPEFSLMSRRPGIGAYWLQEHPDCLELSNISVKGKDTIRVPKYFFRKLQNLPEMFYERQLIDDIKEKRKEFALDRNLLKLSKTDLSYIEMLEVEEQKVLDSVEILNKIRL